MIVRGECNQAVRKNFLKKKDGYIYTHGKLGSSGIH